MFIIIPTYAKISSVNVY